MKPASEGLIGCLDRAAGGRALPIDRTLRARTERDGRPALVPAAGLIGGIDRSARPHIGAHSGGSRRARRDHDARTKLLHGNASGLRAN
jgi:hypothetical protein